MTDNNLDFKEKSYQVVVTLYITDESDCTQYMIDTAYAVDSKNYTNKEEAVNKFKSITEQ